MAPAFIGTGWPGEEPSPALLRGRCLGEGQIIILNGTPRSGKSSIAAAIQSTFEGAWMNLGVDRFKPMTPERYQPGIGLRPGGERPDLEPLVVALLLAVVQAQGWHVGGVGHERAGTGATRPDEGEETHYAAQARRRGVGAAAWAAPVLNRRSCRPAGRRRRGRHSGQTRVPWALCQRRSRPRSPGTSRTTRTWQPAATAAAMSGEPWPVTCSRTLRGTSPSSAIPA